MRKILAAVILAGCAAMLPAVEDSPRFDKPLTGDQAILHALDRLTFGPRPGDVEAVKKKGLSQWIGLQLHPERIPLNPALEAQTQALVEPSAPPLGANRGKKALRPEDVLTARQANVLRAATAQQDYQMLSRLPE